VHHKVRLVNGVVYPVIGTSATAKPHAAHIAFRHVNGFAIINFHMTVHL